MRMVARGRSMVVTRLDGKALNRIQVDGSWACKCLEGKGFHGAFCAVEDHFAVVDSVGEWFGECAEDFGVGDEFDSDGAVDGAEFAADDSSLDGAQQDGCVECAGLDFGDGWGEGDEC